MALVLHLMGGHRLQQIAAQIQHLQLSQVTQTLLGQTPKQNITCFDSLFYNLVTIVLIKHRGFVNKVVMKQRTNKKNYLVITIVKVVNRILGYN
jgi:hypothetical protein